LRDKGQSGAQAGKDRGTGWEDHPEEVDEAPLDDLARDGIVTLLVEVRGTRPVGKLAARLERSRAASEMAITQRTNLLATNSRKPSFVLRAMSTSGYETHSAPGFRLNFGLFEMTLISAPRLCRRTQHASRRHETSPHVSMRK
jgi:hypothetical protein